jgi:hypothetical protein
MATVVTVSRTEDLALRAELPFAFAASATLLTGFAAFADELRRLLLLVGRERSLWLAVRPRVLADLLDERGRDRDVPVREDPLAPEAGAFPDPFEDVAPFEEARFAEPLRLAVAIDSLLFPAPAEGNCYYDGRWSLLPGPAVIARNSTDVRGECFARLLQPSATRAVTEA